MALLAEAIRASASQIARYHGPDVDIVVQQISGREFGDNEISFAVKAVYQGVAEQFEAEDLLETMRQMLGLGVPEAIVQGAGWQATAGPDGADPQSPAHAW